MTLVVVAIFTVAAHYLNGGIRVQQGSPSVAAQVKVHLSVLLAAMALVKAVGYYYARYNLDLSQNGYVQGAGYADVHARLPAMNLLIIISILAAAILVWNIWRRGWALPVLAVGLWAFVALVVGVIYPAIVEAVKVKPAENNLEKPYIADNIAATRSAFGLNRIHQTTFTATQSLTQADVQANQPTLANVQLWDPTQAAPTYTKLQATKSYYTFNTLAVDRYKVNGTLTPMVVGVRQVNDGDLPSQGWVNTHLQYTHGYAMVLSPSNQTNGDQPTFNISKVPPVTSPGTPQVRQPRRYFGLSNPNGGDVNYVLADTRQPEIDYQQGSNTPVTSSYKGSGGGVQLSNLLKKAAFAIRFNDFNLLVSDLVTHKSRIMFVRDIRQMAQKAAPFLSYDSDPYPVLADGQIDWVLDAYTTTDNYPYAQNADTSSLSPNSGLPATFNYVRNSVKVVVNAYTGKMTFYDVSSLTGAEDPILATWEKIFPGMFKSVRAMPAVLRAHIRYPEDLLAVQSAMYGRYHITQPLAFYGSTNAWNVSQTAGAGSPDQSLQQVTTNAQGQVQIGQVQRMSPIYEIFQVPGQQGQSYNLVDAFVPVSRFGGSDTDHVGVHRGRLGPRPLRAAHRVPDAAHRRACVGGCRHCRQSKHLPEDQPPQPRRLQRAVGEPPDRASGRCALVFPALLRDLVAQPLPQPRRLHRGVRGVAAAESGVVRLDAVGFADGPVQCVTAQSGRSDLVFGNGWVGNRQPAGEDSHRPGQHRVPAIAD